MKNVLILGVLLLASSSLFAQCDELFISEYVESGFSNRALEIYNPTNLPIDLSEYLIARFSNGDDTPDGTVQLPSVLLNPYDVFVAVIDKRDPQGTCLEEPIWNGYVEIDVLTDLNGDPIVDEYGDFVMGPQFEEVLCPDGSFTGLSVVESEVYHEPYDLEGKGDGFFSPIYAENRTMYWNGNDAVALVHGTELASDFSNVVDLVGVIGDDPGTGWTDSLGTVMTADASLIKKPYIQNGSVQTIAADSYADEFNYGEWAQLPKYSFSSLGYHVCQCDPNYGGTISKISVLPFVDLNENGELDEGELPLINQPVNLSPTGIYSNSNSQGVAVFYVNPGTYSIESGSLLWEAFNTLEIEIGENEIVDMTFPLPMSAVANFLIQDVDISLGITRCNQETNIWLTYTNKGTVVTDGYIEFIPDPLGTFVSATPAVDSISGDKMYWFYENLLPTHSNQINLVYEMPGVASIGEELNYEAEIQTWEGTGDNKALISSELICAYDPNDKLVSPSGYTADNYTLFEDTLEYTIRFQNTGNDTAFNVIIRDEISPLLNLNSFEFIASSHPVRSTVDLNERLVEFYFEDIYLPDSFVNELASHGFVKFSILGNADLAENSLLANQAGIFFDENPPIITNEVVNTMVSVLPTLPVLSVSPALLDFGELPIDESWYTPQILNIQNYGELPLIIDGFVFDNPAFSVDVGSLTIEGLSTQNITIYFEPEDVGSFHNQLIIESNVGEIEIELAGVGLVGTGLETLVENKYSIYPNPNTGRCFIPFEKVTAFNLKIQNSLGELVLEKNGISDFVNIDLNQERKGLYFVSLETEQGIFNQKMIIQ